MKVVHICHSVTGGAGIAAYRLHSALVAAGIKSSVLCRDLRSVVPGCQKVKRGFFHKISDYFQIPCFNNRYFRLSSSFSDSFEAISFPFSSMKIEKESLICESDIIHLHWVGSMLNYSSFFRNIEKPIVWTFHDMNPFSGFSHYRTDWNQACLPQAAVRLEETVKKFKYRAYEMAHNLNVVCLCEWMKQELELSSMKYETCRIIPNCIDTKIFRRLCKEECRRDLNIPLNKKVVLFVAHSTSNYRKGYDLLDSCVKLCPSDTLLVSVGKSNLQSTETIKHMGNIDNQDMLAKLYNAADIFVIPSREDNLPNTVLESLACGTPVVGVAVGGIKNLVQPLVNGVLAPYATAHDLFAAINTAFTEYHLFKHDDISKTARWMYSPTRVSSEYIQCYKDCLSRCK